MAYDYEQSAATVRVWINGRRVESHWARTLKVAREIRRSLKAEMPYARVTISRKFNAYG